MIVKGNNGKYFVGMAFKSIRKNGLMTMVSIFTVVACLIILGLFLAISVNVNYIGEQIRNDAEITAIVGEVVPEEKLPGVVANIKKIENVASIVLVTREDALDYMREAFGDDASALDGLEDDNPFRNSYKITLKDITLSEQTAKLVNDVAGISEVNNKQDLLDNIIRITDSVRNASMWIMILLCVISVFIIANTIKLSVYARRKEIGIMKFVGATDWFIRWPFIIEGIIIGIIGSIVAFSLISWGYIVAFNAVNTFNIDFFILKSYEEVMFMFMGVFISLGATIGAVGSVISMGKYLEV